MFCNPHGMRMRALQRCSLCTSLHGVASCSSFMLRTTQVDLLYPNPGPNRRRRSVIRASPLDYTLYSYSRTPVRSVCVAWRPKLVRLFALAFTPSRPAPARQHASISLGFRGSSVCRTWRLASGVWCGPHAMRRNASEPWSRSSPTSGVQPARAPHVAIASRLIYSRSS